MKTKKKNMLLSLENVLAYYIYYLKYANHFSKVK